MRNKSNNKLSCCCDSRSYCYDVRYPTADRCLQ